MTTLRHRWSQPNRPSPYKSERTCLRPGCGIIKVTRHEGDRHWVEFFRDTGDGHPEPINVGGTPACEGKQQEGPLFDTGAPADPFGVAR